MAGTELSSIAAARWRRPSNQLSNDRRRRRQTIMDANGLFAAVQSARYESKSGRGIP